MGLLAGNRPHGGTDKHVGLCLLALTLGFQGLGTVINFTILLEMTAAPSNVG